MVKNRCFLLKGHKFKSKAWDISPLESNIEAFSVPVPLETPHKREGLLFSLW